MHQSRRLGRSATKPRSRNRMKTVSITLYTYDELSKTAQAKARDKHRELCPIDLDLTLDLTLDDAKQIARAMGFDVDRIPYCGFHSQGDGASITGEWVANRVDPAELPDCLELVKLCAEFAEIATRNPEARVHLNPYYSSRCHEYSVDYVFCDMAEDDEENFKSAARRLMKWIYHSLEAEYEHLTSDDTIGETLTENEHFFTEDGTFYHE